MERKEMEREKKGGTAERVRWGGGGGVGKHVIT
jgi:hypothetical protein